MPQTPVPFAPSLAAHIRDCPGGGQIVVTTSLYPPVAGIYRGASGKLARRADWDRCREQLRAGDELVVTRLDRVGRSVAHLIQVVGELGGRGVELVVLDQGIDTTSPGGRLLFHVLAAMSKFVGDLISENTRDGLAAARARGRVEGRPSVMTPAKLRQLHEGGEHTITGIAAAIGVGRPTVYRHLDRSAAAPSS